jgi:hypothetical protein
MIKEDCATETNYLITSSYIELSSNLLNFGTIGFSSFLRRMKERGRGRKRERDSEQGTAETE